MKVKAYFSRREPFYLLSANAINDSQGFDAYPVEVDPVALANITSVRNLIMKMEKGFMEGGAPEETAQAECDMFVEEVRKIFKTRAQDNG